MPEKNPFGSGSTRANPRTASAMANRVERRGPAGSRKVAINLMTIIQGSASRPNLCCRKWKRMWLAEVNSLGRGAQTSHTPAKVRDCLRNSPPSIFAVVEGPSFGVGHHAIATENRLQGHDGIVAEV
jgi:hypothetical protein